MNKIGMEKKAITIIRNFLKDYRLDSLDDLKTFSFWKIKDDKDYNGYPGEYDGDRTNIVYAIDYLLYKDSIPNLTLRGFPCSNGKEGNYSGETINTFNTLFARDLNKRKEIQIKFGSEWFLIQDVNEEHNPFANDFYHVYQRIGNFMLLPNTKPNSLNNLKGSCFEPYKDYTDLFLKDLKIVLSTDNEIKNKKMNQIIKLDELYFKNKTFDQFIKDFYLNEYKLLTIDGFHYYHKLLENEKIFDDYKNFALKYVEQATKFIKLRSEEIINILKTNYFS